MVRKRFPDNVRSFLFYGPPGTGKTMIVRACSYETNSIIFDMSPINIEGKYTNKKEEDKLEAALKGEDDDGDPKKKKKKKKK